MTLVLSGGFGHDFAATTALLGATETVTTIAEFGAALPRHRQACVNALYWSMQQDEKYAPRRSMAVTATDEDIRPLAHWLAAGGRLLALHTAVICFDTAPAWRALLGGGWTWGTSWHPPVGPAWVYPRGQPGFAQVDEVYHRLDPAADCTIIAHADAGHGRQPVAWTRVHGRGRVAVNALGHDCDAMAHPGQVALRQRLWDWLEA